MTSNQHGPYVRGYTRVTMGDPSRSAKGDGLGLSIAKTVFDLHGYACGAENTEIGPKFWFQFADK